MTDETLMELALEEAHLALQHGDVPVGAVVVHNGTVISRAHNERELRQDPTAHAEILALRLAAKHLNTWRLSETTLVVTLEPCVMCAGACVASRLGRVVFGTTDAKAGGAGSLYNLCADPRLNHEVLSTGGVLSERCANILKTFFASRRQATSGEL